MRKGRQTKNIKGLINRDGVNIKYMITSDVGATKWEIAVKDMSTQKLICDKIPFPAKVIQQVPESETHTHINKIMDEWVDRNADELKKNKPQV